MVLPNVTITELDGALGVLSPSGGKLLAVVGVSSSGPVNTPAAFSRIRSFVSAFGVGPGVESVAHAIERYGRPVLFVRAGTHVAGAYGEIDDDGVEGTSVVTATANTEPLDHFEVVVQVVAGGTIGEAGITYRYSIDGGESFSGTLALGTADTIAIPGTGVSFDLGAGTLVTDDEWSVTTTGPHGTVANAGAYGSINTLHVSGTSVVTATSGSEPLDDYEVVVEVLNGGTIGVTGITYRVSLDGARNFGPTTALGTTTSIGIAGSGVSFDLAAGTLVAGDTWSVRTSAPTPSASEIGDALDALKATTLPWEIAHIAAPMDGTIFDTVETKIVGMAASGKYRAWVGNFRMPNLGESSAAYQAAFVTAFGSKATTHGMVCAGACKLTSSVSGRKYKRPWSFVQAAREASVSEEINTADVNLGAYVGVSIRDSNGNPDEHDEAENPGLDDARACVARTWEGIEGVYTNRPRLLSPEGSDFQLLPHRRVLNLAHDALRRYFLRRLSRPVRVDKTTGFIVEADALEIEAGALAAMRAVLLAKPKASAVQFTLSRTDNLLSTKTMTGQARVVPLAYPEHIELDVGFLNPALQVQRAA